MPACRSRRRPVPRSFRCSAATAWLLVKNCASSHCTLAARREWSPKMSWQWSPMPRRSTIDGLIDAAFAGGTRELEIHLGKARTAGIAGGSMLSAALRHVAQLHKARLAIEGGASIVEASRENPAIRALQPQELGGGGAAQLDVAAARTGDGATGRSGARRAPAIRNCRIDRAARPVGARRHARESMAP